MGKSPGKWIKGILFGKKSSNSNLSKGRTLSKSASEKPVRVSPKESTSTLIVDALLISNPFPATVINVEDNSRFEKGEDAKSAYDGLVSSSPKQDGDMSTVSDPGPSTDSEKMKLERAATVVQASFRSYKARCEFQALKGIIKLQAVIRGRLVQRQAVATLYCVQGIIKFQAIARGNMVRRSSIANEHGMIPTLVSKDTKHQDYGEFSKYGPSNKLFKNLFVIKLLSSSPNTMPLRLQYVPTEANSTWSWLFRWSTLQVGPPNSKQKETCDLHEAVEMEKSKTKDRKASINDHKHGDGETGKLKHNAKKLSSLSVKSAQENLHTGNDKVKRGIKKNPKPTIMEAEVDIEKPKNNPRKLSKSPAPKLSELTANTLNKPMEDLEEVVSEHIDVESSLELPEANDNTNQLNNHYASEDRGEPEKTQERSPIDKSSWRTTLPEKDTDREASPNSAIRMPSYMATTASSKAKVKVQVSPRFGQDATDKNGLTRRHSLPSSINVKQSSSPKVAHKLVQTNGRGGVKFDRSLSSSRDVTDKMIQAEWKR